MPQLRAGKHSWLLSTILSPNPPVVLCVLHFQDSCCYSGLPFADDDLCVLAVVSLYFYMFLSTFFQDSHYYNGLAFASDDLHLLAGVS